MNFYVNFDTLLEKSLCIQKDKKRIYKKFIFYKIIKKKKYTFVQVWGKGVMAGG